MNRVHGLHGRACRGVWLCLRCLLGLRRLWRGLLCGVALGVVLLPTAFAHEMSMAELNLRETARGEFVLQWGAGNRGGTEELRPLWPSQCDAQAGALRCGQAGLSGRLAIEGIGNKGWSAVLVRVLWLDGQASTYTLTARQTQVQVFGSADDQRGLGEVAHAYTLLGVEHILSGIDHLLFVMALLFLVGFRRRLVWTISAFTLAHSATLALGALEILTLRAPPVEASIALSIMLVAGEALHRRPTLARRWPALVAFLFGLVHGLGFAGALQEIGLPQQHLALALLTFNLGVELGQLLAVGAAWVLWRSLQRAAWFMRLRTPALYGIGGLAAYWTLTRVAAIAT